MKKYYLYTNFETALEFFTLNKIVCNDYLILKNHQVQKSISMVSGKFLFITTKLLTHEYRTYGFSEYIQSGAYPIAFEIVFNENDESNVPVIPLLADGTLGEDFVTLNKVLDDVLGVFVRGEISTSFVARILFESEKEQNEIYKPSADLYFPENKYSLLDDSFKDEFDAKIVLDRAKTLDEKFQDEDVAKEVLKRNKITSMLCNTVLETHNWKYGDRHEANFDSFTRKFLRPYIKEEDIVLKADEKYEEIIKNEDQDELLANAYQLLLKKNNQGGELVFAALNDFEIQENADATFSAKLFEIILWKLINSISSPFTKEDFDDLKGEIYLELEKINDISLSSSIKEVIEKMKSLVYENALISLDELLEKLTQFPVLKGFLFFLRQSKDDEKLTESLRVYYADPIVWRYAWIMYAALNGLEPLIAKKKGNSFVFREAERISVKCIPLKNMISDISSENNFERNFAFVVSRVITKEEYRVAFLSDQFSPSIPDLISAIVANKLIPGFKDKDYSYYEYDKSAFDTTSIKEFCEKWEHLLNDKCEASIATLKKSIAKSEKLFKKSKKKKYRCEEFTKKYIQDEVAFGKFFNRSKQFIKEFYEKRRLK